MTSTPVSPDRSPPAGDDAAGPQDRAPAAVAADEPAGAAAAPPSPEAERLQRWRLVLGSEAQPSCGALQGRIAEMDRALAALYEPNGPQGLGGDRRGGRGGSAPQVARWLGDIRQYFPSSVVQVMQRDALQRLQLTEMLTQPEMLEAVQPDVHLVASLISLASVIPAGTRETARAVVRRVVDELMKRLEEPLRAAVTGALDRSQRNRRPRHAEIDWHRTIRANLRHWQPELRTLVPETLIGYGRKARRPQREVILCIDQSGSMAASVVYSSIFGAVLASLPAVATRLVVFDTAVVDLTEQLHDPVDLLFGVQLGGGTDIEGAVAYCQSQIRDPRNTILVLISDLYEGGVEAKLLRRAAELVESGVQVVTLLALSDEGAPAFDRDLAAKLAALGVPSFACTPDAFPGLMAAAIRREDVSAWAAGQGLVTSRAGR
ncbi:VWA domain-containing protein [Eleftheria terrae]|uniref:VWA domain-containing protein n=1 Tax=Eleftheria terrae TaxID=1597781 RepID=UPI00263B21F2|nr:VWA domain-containing protein [Eleftheria terrae]WKB53444.1 VWA domain-containing protein [Eleftheria terrae]